MSLKETIEQKLTEALAPTILEVMDESDRHVGHDGARPEGETHFCIKIVSKELAGLTRVGQHQRIYAILAEEMAGPVHALRILVKKS